MASCISVQTGRPESATGYGRAGLTHVPALSTRSGAISALPDTENSNRLTTAKQGVTEFAIDW
jgi:hypothetical protein